MKYVLVALLMWLCSCEKKPVEVSSPYIVYDDAYTDTIDIFIHKDSIKFDSTGTWVNPDSTFQIKTSKRKDVGLNFEIDLSKGTVGIPTPEMQDTLKSIMSVFSEGNHDMFDINGGRLYFREPWHLFLRDSITNCILELGPDFKGDAFFVIDVPHNWDGKLGAPLEGNIIDPDVDYLKWHSRPKLFKINRLPDISKLKVTKAESGDSGPYLDSIK